MLKRVIGKTVFKLNGWTYDNKPDLWSNKQVVIGFPHTTNMDAVRSVALFYALNIENSTLIKKELFFWPLSIVLRGIGALEIDRETSKNIVQTMINEFQQRPAFTLVLAPEGTRGKNQAQQPIRTGFWHIAKGANVPIVLMCSDNQQQRGRFLAKIQPTELQSDLLSIQQLYQEVGVHIAI